MSPSALIPQNAPHRVPANGDLRLEYQPLIQISNEATLGFEATLGMPSRARHVALLRPKAVAVHDEGDMVGDGSHSHCVEISCLTSRGTLKNSQLWCNLSLKEGSFSILQTLKVSHHIALKHPHASVEVLQ